MAIAQSESAVLLEAPPVAPLWLPPTDSDSPRSRFKHVAVPDGARDQQRGGQPGGAAACPLLPAAAQPPPAEPDAAVAQPHEPAALHGVRHTLAQSVTLLWPSGSFYMCAQ